MTNFFASSSSSFRFKGLSSLSLSTGCSFLSFFNNAESVDDRRFDVIDPLWPQSHLLLEFSSISLVSFLCVVGLNLALNDVDA